ncbi:ATP-binding protein [Mycobacterium frederiksbergense]|uniref:tetratricopeptide repeat protein n=1 Tax=Mycolicibacterium frederiksbergense TaxID=117567 RepID=UPI0021F358BE|nr:tetratricopeptide repeat protein [Mycolicibacterium frederiksbergense]MCV7045473.1 ATP-binding protein [Mycolicibacterium frederiksbergense]
MAVSDNDAPRVEPQSRVEITANNNSTAIGSVRQLVVSDASGIAIGRVESLNVFQPQTPKASTTVLPVAALRSSLSSFVGRGEQLKVLRDFLLSASDEPSVTVVVGAPGVGKTAFVRHAALSAVDQKPFPQALFTDLHGYDEAPSDRVQAVEMYGPLLQGLGIAGNRIPESVSERARFYHDTLNQFADAGQSVLIWLDNVSERSQIEGLVASSPLHRTVVTTRDTFPPARSQLRIELDVLPIDDAVDVLKQEIQHGGDTRVDSDLEASQRLAELCDRLPLALQIIASLVVDESSRPISEFESELRAEEHRLDALHYDDRLSVRAALALSYKRLPEKLQRLFRLLSQVPGGDVGIDAARWIVEMDAAAVRPQLMALVRAHLVQQHVTNRWSMHDLVRLFAAEMAAQDPADADRSLKTLVGHFGVKAVMAFEWLTAVASERTRQVFETPADAAQWFDGERATAVAIVLTLADRAEYQALVVEFGVALGDLLRSQAHWREDFHNVAATVASVAARGEPQLVAASALSNFGTSLRMQRKYDESYRVFDESVAMYTTLGDMARASGARSNIANLLQEQERLDEAIAMYRKDLQQCPPSTHPYAAANTLANFGAVLVKAGRPGEGATQLLKAVVLCRKLDDRSGLATALRNLGAAYIEQSTRTRDVVTARKAVTALADAREISNSMRDAKGRADASNNLAVALCSLRDFERGIALFDEALEYYDQTGQVDQANRTRWHQNQARRAAARQ